MHLRLKAEFFSAALLNLSGSGRDALVEAL
jgi:hypothetical protein